jgi:hypothetical protein
MINSRFLHLLARQSAKVGQSRSKSAKSRLKSISAKTGLKWLSLLTHAKVAASEYQLAESWSHVRKVMTFKVSQGLAESRQH